VLDGLTAADRSSHAHSLTAGLPKSGSIPNVSSPTRNLRTFMLAYAARRINSNLNGGTNKFRWLQAPESSSRLVDRDQVRQLVG
jgi:hypothetical protein